MSVNWSDKKVFNLGLLNWFFFEQKIDFESTYDFGTF